MLLILEFRDYLYKNLTLLKYGNFNLLLESLCLFVLKYYVSL